MYLKAPKAWNQIIGTREIPRFRKALSKLNWSTSAFLVS